jgi:hypothetical protein
VNILDKLPFLSSTTEEEAAEFDEAQAKKDRIEFHRRSVRNGPVSYRTPTNGQIKRERKRALARETKKARRRQVRQHLANQREAATIAAHLRGAGILAYSQESFTTDPQRARRSIIWIVARFAEAPQDGTGRVEVTEAVVRQSLTAALNRWQSLVGLRETPLSPAYVLPVALAS